jgi:hypothetical protein
LLPGRTYLAVAAGANHNVALCSDGSVVAWGDYELYQLAVPALPPGLHYIDVAAAANHNVALRSDGSVVAWGWNSFGQLNVPALPPGLRYVEVEAGARHAVARRSDGCVVAWGDNTHGQLDVPALPPGLTYVEVAAGELHTVARRSDGSVVAWGDNSWGQLDVPSLPPGLTYADIAEVGAIAARIGLPSTYVTFATGCAGSLPAARLVALDTPRIDATLQISLNNLPADAALLLLGFSNTSCPLAPLPLGLAAFGMPGCTLYTSVEIATLVAGSGGRAEQTLAIPNDPLLVGARFYHQALVLDPAAGNPLGAVMSDAATAVVGDR